MGRAADSLVINLGASFGTAAATVGTGLLTVPLIIHSVGLDGYGVWTLGRTIMVYTGSAEIGLGPAIQRHIGLARGRESQETPAAVLWSALLLYGALGIVLGVMGVATASVLVSLFGIPDPMRAAATAMLNLIAVAVCITLLHVACHNVLQGLEQFAASALAVVVSSIVFLGGVAASVVFRWGLVGLGWAAVGQAAVTLGVRVWILRGVIFAERPRLLKRHEFRTLLSLAGRLQVTAITGLINTQTDKLVVGLIAGPRALGEIGVAAQVAEAVRGIGAAALPPLVSRFAMMWSASDDEKLAFLYRRTVRLAVAAGLGLTITFNLALWPLIVSWIGGGHTQATIYTCVLITAYSTFLVCVPALAFLRAGGTVRPEMTYGLTTTALNVVLSGVLGTALGPIGVVGATLGAYAIGSLWMLRRARDLAPRLTIDWRGAAWMATAAAVAGACALLWGILMVYATPDGLSFVATGAGLVLAFFAYAMWVSKSGHRGERAQTTLRAPR